MSQFTRWLGMMLVLLFWAAVVYFTGLGSFLFQHGKQFTFVYRIISVAVGVVVTIALLLFVDGKGRAFAKTVLAPIGLIAVFAFEPDAVFEDISFLPIRFFLNATVFLLLLVPMFFFVVTFGYSAWPLVGYLAGVAAVLLLVELTRGDDGSGQKSVLLKTTRGLLLPISFGLSIVCVMQAVFDLFDEDTKSIRLIENHIGYLSKEAKAWVDFSLPSTIALTLSLMFVALLIPRLKPVTRGGKVLKYFHSISSVVACVSSFTFFAQAPFKYQDHIESHRIEAERKEKPVRNDLRLVAAKSLDRSLKKLTLEDKASIREEYEAVFSEINDTVPYRDQGRVLEAMAQHAVSAVPNSQEMADALDTMERKSGYNPEGEGADKTEGEQKDLSTGPNEELIAGLSAIFGELIGTVVPEFEGMSAKFIDSLVDKEADYYFDHHLKPVLSAHLNDVMPLTTAFSDSLLNRFRMQQSSKEDIQSVVGEEMKVVREEVLAEEERVREEQRVQEERAPHEIFVEP